MIRIPFAILFVALLVTATTSEALGSGAAPKGWTVSTSASKPSEIAIAWELSANRAATYTATITPGGQACTGGGGSRTTRENCAISNAPTGQPVLVAITWTNADGSIGSTMSTSATAGVEASVAIRRIEIVGQGVIRALTCPATAMTASECQQLAECRATCETAMPRGSTNTPAPVLLLIAAASPGHALTDTPILTGKRCARTEAERRLEGPDPLRCVIDGGWSWPRLLPFEFSPIKKQFGRIRDVITVRRSVPEPSRIRLNVKVNRFATPLVRAVRVRCSSPSGRAWTKSVSVASVGPLNIATTGTLITFAGLPAATTFTCTFSLDSSSLRNLTGTIKLGTVGGSDSSGGGAGSGSGGGSSGGGGPSGPIVL